MIREALLQPGRQRLGGHGNTSTYLASMVFPIRGCGNRWEIKTPKIGCLNVLCKVSVLPSTRLTAARLSQFMIWSGYAWRDALARDQSVHLSFPVEGVILTAGAAFQRTSVRFVRPKRRVFQAIATEIPATRKNGKFSYGLNTKKTRIRANQCKFRV